MPNSLQRREAALPSHYKGYVHSLSCICPFIESGVDFQSQNTPPTPPDLIAAYSLLQAARKTNQNFFAFFNCGDRSGASQRHKHLQLIPTKADGPPVEKLAKMQNVETESALAYLKFLSYA